MGDWALCVGIGNYGSSSRLDPLPGALNDAKAMYDWIVDPQGGNVPEANAKLILSPEPQVDDFPSPAADAVGSFLRARYRDAEASRQSGNGFTAGRRLWLYFSGHGIGFPDDGEDTGLLTADAVPPLRDFPHIAGKAWAEAFRITKAFDEVVLFMDCCRLETNRTALTKPAVQVFKATPPGKLLAAFAVSASKAAFEADSAIHGVPRGKFTVALEELLKNRSNSAVMARDFLDQLALQVPDCDPLPMSPHTDFEFLTARNVVDPTADASLLIAHSESTASLASAFALALSKSGRDAQVKWMPDVLSNTDPNAYQAVRELIVTRDVNPAELQDLVEKVRPRRTTVFSRCDPGVADIPGVQFLELPENTEGNLDAQIVELVKAIEEKPGQLVVLANPPLVKTRVWDENGHSIASGFGRLEKVSLPPGRYHVRISIGAHFSQLEAEVSTGATTVVSMPSLQMTAPYKLLDWGISDSIPNSSRSIYEGNIDGSRVYLSAPRIEGWRLEVLTPFADRPDELSVRLVPNTHPLGSPHEMDAIRESLKLALVERSWDATKLSLDAVASDPICILLAAALRLKCGQTHEEFTNIAADLLGESDVDVQLLRGGATIEAPPLVSFLWHYRLKRNELAVKPNSLADQMVNRLGWNVPWLTWLDETAIMKRSWLGEVANVVWPGWNSDAPDADLALADVSLGASDLGAPADSVMRRTYKAPPVDRLVQHQEIACVGASNDQLPAAIAIAFVERGRKKWPRIDVWSLSDEKLAQVNSDGRSVQQLLAARNRSERQLQQLLKVVADEWSVRRYGGLDVEYESDGTAQSVWCFASLWDWTKPGGYVHVSPYTIETNVRTADFQDLIWTASQPPVVYRATVKAYELLLPGEILSSS